MRFDFLVTSKARGEPSVFRVLRGGQRGERGVVAAESIEDATR